MPDAASDSALASEDPPLPNTPRHDRPDPSTKRSPFTPAQRWVGDNQVKLALVAIAVVSPLLSLKWAVGAVAATKQAVWVYSTDAAGVISYAPVSMASPDAGIYKEIAMQAVQTFFTRNPRGLSFSEFADRLFAGDALADIQTILKVERNDRERRNLFDHPEVTKVELRDEGLFRYRVSGYIVRSGASDGLPLREIADFVMTVELAQQPKAGEKGRFPFAATKFAYRVTWRGEQRTEEWPRK